MRVAFVVGAFPTTSETFILQQVNSLATAGVDVEVFPLESGYRCTPHANGDEHIESRVYRKPAAVPNILQRWTQLTKRVTSLNAEGRHAVRAALKSSFRSPRRLAFGSFFDLQRLIERMPFDIVHAHFGHFGLRCAELPWDASMPPLITTFHGWDANVAPSRLGPNCYDSLFNVGAAFTVNSEFLRKRVVQLGCPPERIQKLPMGVDLERFPYKPRTRKPNDPARLLTVGRLVAVKGHRYAIQAVAQLRNEGVAVEYSIIGGGPLLEELQELSRNLGVADIVTFCGPQSFDKVRNAYYNAHIFVLPSVRLDRGDEETQGVVVQEAQATGMPVVVTDAGGVAEGICIDESGVVCQSGNTATLTDAVKTVVKREADWPVMGNSGRKTVEHRYDNSRLIHMLIRVYSTLATGDYRRQSLIESLEQEIGN